MTFEILFEVFLFGIALSADAFSVSIAQGLTFIDLNKKRSLFIALVYGVFQALFPLAGFWVVEIISIIAGEAGGAQAGEIMSTVVTWVAFALLMYLGIKMIVESVIEIKKPIEEKNPRKFTIKEVLIMGVATAIDALATGVAFHNKNSLGVALSTTSTIWLHVSIIMVCTFIISLCGVNFGKLFEKLFKGKYEIAGIIGGSILTILGIWVVLSHYLL